MFAVIRLSLIFSGIKVGSKSHCRAARIRVVSALGRFGLGRFGLGRFGPILGWAVSASVGGSIRPWVVSALCRFGRSLYQNVDCLGQADKQIDR